MSRAGAMWFALTAARRASITFFDFEYTNQSKKRRAGAAVWSARAAQARAAASICVRGRMFFGSGGPGGRLGIGGPALKNVRGKSANSHGRGEVELARVASLAKVLFSPKNIIY